MTLAFPPNPCNVSPMNLTTFLAQAAPVATGKFMVDWNTILMAAMTMMTALGVPFIAYLVLKLKANSEKTAAALVEVSKKTDSAVETLKEVKLDVNSGKTKLEDKLTKVEEKLLIITGEKATLGEKVRSEQDKAVALAATKVAPSAVAHAAGPERLGAAINELAAAAEETKESSKDTTEAAEKTEELARKHKTP